MRTRMLATALIMITTVSGAQTQAASAPPAAAPTASSFADRAPRYELVPGDILGLRFEFSPELNQTGVAVQPDGFITLEGIGDVAIAGHTLPEARQILQQQYSKILNAPEISVTLQEFSKPYFVASGYFARPGKYDLHGPMMLTEAVAMAGGFRDGARHSEVWVFHRLRDGTVQSKRVDVKRMLAKANLAEDVRLAPGDTIYVPQSTLSKLESFIIPRATVGPTLSPTMP